MEKETGGPAFPKPKFMEQAVRYEQEDGMTLRDYFAAKAMQGDIATYTGDLIYETPEWFEARALKWYDVADAMLKARAE